MAAQFKGAAVPELNFDLENDLDLQGAMAKLGVNGKGRGSDPSIQSSTPSLQHSASAPMDASAFGLCEIDAVGQIDPVNRAVRKFKGLVKSRQLPSLVLKTDANNGTQVLDALGYMKRGSPIAKYKTSNTWKKTKKWPFDCRMFELSECGTFLSFYSRKEVLQTIRIEGIAEVVKGQKSAEFVKRPWPEMASLSFSICYHDDQDQPQVFDAVCVKQIDFDVWVNTLNQIKGSRGPLPQVHLTSPIYENQKLKPTLELSDRWLKGKKGDPEARRVMAEKLVAQCEKLVSSKHLISSPYLRTASHKLFGINQLTDACAQNIVWEKFVLANEQAIQAVAEAQALELKLRCMRKEVRNGPKDPLVPFGVKPGSPVAIATDYDLM